jgi:hypothetical protein
MRGSRWLWNPQCWGEDGNVFFREAYHLSFWDSVMRPYNGYYHLIPRLVAEFAILFRIEFIPSVFAWSTLIISIACCSLFLLDHFN